MLVTLLLNSMAMTGKAVCLKYVKIALLDLPVEDSVVAVAALVAALALEEDLLEEVGLAAEEGLEEVMVAAEGMVVVLVAALLLPLLLLVTMLLLQQLPRTHLRTLPLQVESVARLFTFVM